MARELAPAPGLVFCFCLIRPGMSPPDIFRTFSGHFLDIFRTFVKLSPFINYYLWLATVRVVELAFFQAKNFEPVLSGGSIDISFVMFYVCLICSCEFSTCCFLVDACSGFQFFIC